MSHRKASNPALAALSSSLRCLGQCALLRYPRVSHRTLESRSHDRPPLPLMGGIGFHPSIQPNATGRALLESVTRPLLLGVLSGDPTLGP